MPISKDFPDVIRCINHESHKGYENIKTTMMPASGWFAITGIVPPDLKNNIKEASFRPNEGMPLKVYVCSVCGYVELYNGMIADKNTWTVNKGV